MFSGKKKKEKTITSSSQNGAQSKGNATSNSLEYQKYFGFPLDCIGNFSEAIARHKNKVPSCVSSTTMRKGKIHRITLKKAFPHLITLLGYLCGGHQFQTKGYRMDDLFYCRKTLLLLLAETKDFVPAPTVQDGSASSTEKEDAIVLNEDDEDDSQADDTTRTQNQDEFVADDESEIDLYASIRQIIETTQIQTLQTIGIYYQANSGEKPPVPGL